MCPGFGRSVLTAPSVCLYVQSRPSRTTSARMSSSAMSRSASAAIPSAPSGISGAPAAIRYLHRADGNQTRPRRCDGGNLRTRTKLIHPDARLVRDQPIDRPDEDDGVVVKQLIRAKVLLGAEADD